MWELRTLHEQEHHTQIKLEMKSAYDAWRQKGVVTRRLLDRLWDFGYQEPELKRQPSQRNSESIIF